MGGRRRSTKHVEAVLRTGTDNQISKALRNLPEDIDAQLAAQLVLSDFARLDQRFPARVARAILELLDEPARTEGHELRLLAVFMVTVLPRTLNEAELAKKWQSAVRAYFAMGTTYGWGSRQKREKIASVAANPDFVRGVQAIAVGCENVGRDVLAVLCSDGSDESLDALMPHFDRAERNGKRLKELIRLDTHANPESAAVRSLLDTARIRLRAISQQSPARALAEHIGIGSPEVFWFDGSVSSEEPSGGIPRYQGHVKVDSRTPRWFSVGMTHVDVRPGSTYPASHFDNESAREDRLGLGVCTAEELPAWLQRTARKLDVAWSAPYVSSSVRGKKRKAIEDWLRGSG